MVRALSTSLLTKYFFSKHTRSFLGPGAVFRMSQQNNKHLEIANPQDMTVKVNFNARKAKKKLHLQVQSSV